MMYAAIFEPLLLDIWYQKHTERYAKMQDVDVRFAQYSGMPSQLFEDSARVEEVWLFIGDEKDNQTRLGQRLPLEVTWRLNGSWKESDSLEVYCADGKVWLTRFKILLTFYKEHVAGRWPFIPVRSHISSDPSSPECLNQARKWLDYCLHNHSTSDCGKQVHSELPTRVLCVRDSFNDPFIYEAAPGETGRYAALSYCWVSKA